MFGECYLGTGKPLLISIINRFEAVPLVLFVGISVYTNSNFVSGLNSIVIGASSQ